MMITPENVMLRLNEHRKFGKYCDVILCIDDQKFYCHRAILASATAYFEGMFGNNYIERNEKCITLMDVDIDGFEILLDYIYTGKIELNMRTLKNALSVAIYFRVECLIEKCLKFIMDNIDDNNALEYYTFADYIGYTTLKSYVTNYIEQNFSSIIRTKDFYEIPFVIFEKFISSDATSVDGEKQIFDIIMNWINHKFEDRSHYFSELMKSVRFNFISSEYMHSHILENEFIKSSHKNVDLISKYSEKYFNSRKYNSFVYIFGNIKCNDYSKIVTLCYNGTTIDEKPEMSRFCEISDLHAASLNGSVYMATSDFSTEENTFCKFNKEHKKWMALKTPSISSSILHMIPLNKYNSIYMNVNSFKNAMQTIDYNVYYYITEFDNWYSAGFNSYTNNRGFSIYGAVLINYENVVYSMGGADRFNYSSQDVLLFDPRIGSWMCLSHAPDTVQFVCGSHFRSKMYLTGIHHRSIATDTLCVYNIIANKWEPKRSLTGVRPCYSVVPYEDRIYVIWRNQKHCSILEVYDPIHDDWENGPDIEMFNGKVVAVCK